MNRLIVLAYAKTPPATLLSRSTSPESADSPRIASFSAEILPYKRDDLPMPIHVTAWGSVAERVMANIKQDSYAELTGRLRIEKNQPPEFQIDGFHRVMLIDRPGVNGVCLVGRAGRDPEVRYFESGGVVANLTLAVNRASRDDEADWFDLAVWGQQAQVAADYVRKGSLLGITGSFTLDRWTDRSTGEERSKPVIRVVRLDLLGSKRDSEGGDPVRPAAPASASAWSGIDEGGDEIPF